MSHTLSIWERVMDYIARLHRDPPVCDICGKTMRYQKAAGDLWAWECVDSLRNDHLTELEDP